MTSKAALLMLVLLGVIFFYTSASTDVADFMNYQGRLTDPAGNPVMDDNYSITFTIYDDGGAQVWIESQKVTTSDGYFTVLLGDNGSPLSCTDFSDSEYYLGITVGGDPEMTPRIRLATVPFSFKTGTVDGARGGAIKSDVNIDSDLELGSISNSGELRLYMDGSAAPVATANNYSTYGGQIILNDELGNKVISAQPDIDGEGGFFNVMGGPLEEGFTVDGNFAGSNSPYVSIEGSGSSTHFYSHISGNNSVQLPTGAVGSEEMYNEPGLTYSTSTGTYTLETTMKDLRTVTITIPEDGYIYLLGQCYMRTYGATSDNRLYAQIDETSGGSYTIPYVVGAGMSQYPSIGSYYYPTFVQRVSYKNAGTYTFRLEAMKTSSAHTSSASQITLTAIYIPTGYGAVKAVVSDPSDFEDITPVSYDSESELQPSEPLYEVDLRELELRAAKLKAAALEAERALYEAQRQNSEK